MTLRRAISVASVAAAIALAGCGGGGGGSSSGTSTASGPTHAQYVSAANAICATARRQTAPLIAKVKSSASSLLTGGGGGLATVVTHLHDVAGANLARLRALAQPAGGGAAIGRFLRPLATVIADIGQAAKALAKGQALDAVSLISQAQPLAATVAIAARAYGATQCGSVLAALG